MAACGKVPGVVGVPPPYLTRKCSNKGSKRSEVDLIELCSPEKSLSGADSKAPLATCEVEWPLRCGRGEGAADPGALDMICNTVFNEPLGVAATAGADDDGSAAATTATKLSGGAAAPPNAPPWWTSCSAGPTLPLGDIGAELGRNAGTTACGDPPLRGDLGEGVRDESWMSAPGSILATGSGLSAPPLYGDCTMVDSLAAPAQNSTAWFSPTMSTILAFEFGVSSCWNGLIVTSSAPRGAGDIG